MIETSVSELFSRLQPDQWRQETGWSLDIAEAQNTLFSESCDAAESEQVLNNWIGTHQPCIFGKLAAHFGWIKYCILTESDLLGSDEALRNKIQKAGWEWRQGCYAGQQSGFVIAAISPQIAYATPNNEVLDLAKRLAYLYLRKPIEKNQIYNDAVELELGSRGPVRQWLTGINYFCAQGDQRWWHDHRIPGRHGFFNKFSGAYGKVRRACKCPAEPEGAF